MQNYHAKAYLSFKARPGQTLSREERHINRLHSAIRIHVEHVIRSVKCFRILVGR